MDLARCNSSRDASRGSLARAHAELLADRRHHARAGARCRDDDLHATRPRRPAATALSKRRPTGPHRQPVAEDISRRGVRDLEGPILRFQGQQRRPRGPDALRRRHAAGARRRSASGRTHLRDRREPHDVRDARNSPAARPRHHGRRRAADRPASRGVVIRVLATAIWRRSPYRRPADQAGGRSQCHDRRRACTGRARARPDAGDLAAESPRSKRSADQQSHAPRDRSAQTRRNGGGRGRGHQATPGPIRQGQSERLLQELRREDRLCHARDVAPRPRDRGVDRARSVAPVRGRRSRVDHRRSERRQSFPGSDRRAPPRSCGSNGPRCRPLATRDLFSFGERSPRARRRRRRRFARRRASPRGACARAADAAAPRRGIARRTERRLQHRDGATLFGVVFGLIPLFSAKVDVATLRDAGRGLTTSKRRETSPDGRSYWRRLRLPSCYSAAPRW